MNDYEAHSSIVRWMNNLLNVPVIKDHQGGKAPGTPYVMVNLIGMTELHYHAQYVEYENLEAALQFNAVPLTFNGISIGMTEGGPAGDVLARPRIEVEWHFSVHSYGDSPTSRLRPVLTASKLSQVLEPAFPDLTIHRVSQIRNVPDWINERWQPRGQMDVYVRGIIRDGHIIDVIEQTEFDIQAM